MAYIASAGADWPRSGLDTFTLVSLVADVSIATQELR